MKYALCGVLNIIVLPHINMHKCRGVFLQPFCEKVAFPSKRNPSLRWGSINCPQKPARMDVSSDEDKFLGCFGRISVKRLVRMHSNEIKDVSEALASACPRPSKTQ